MENLSEVFFVFVLNFWHQMIEKNWMGKKGWKLNQLFYFFDNNQIGFFQSDYSIHTNKRIFIDSIINQSNVFGKKQKKVLLFTFNQFNQSMIKKIFKQITVKF